jgi:hypothetical protein
MSRREVAAFVACAVVLGGLLVWAVEILAGAA